MDENEAPEVSPAVKKYGEDALRHFRYHLEGSTPSTFDTAGKLAGFLVRFSIGAPKGLHGDILKYISKDIEALEPAYKAKKSNLAESCGDESPSIEGGLFGDTPLRRRIMRERGAIRLAPDQDY